MIFNSGIMDKDYMWEVEDALRKAIKLKEDDNEYCEISIHGYDQYYLENREKLKKLNLYVFIEEEFKKFQDVKLEMDKIEIPAENFIPQIQKRNDLYTESNHLLFDNDTNTYFVLGFMYLHHQLDICSHLKENIFSHIDNEIFILNKYKNETPEYELYYDEHIHSLNVFRDCISKSDGSDMEISGIIIPKRSLFN